MICHLLEGMCGECVILYSCDVSIYDCICLIELVSDLILFISSGV